jgi:hypothetical protein
MVLTARRESRESEEPREIKAALAIQVLFLLSFHLFMTQPKKPSQLMRHG